MRHAGWLAAALVAAGSCAPASTEAATGGATIEIELPDGRRFALAAPPRRIVPANVAAAEFLCPLVGPERLAALPEQLEGFSYLDAHAEAFATLPRFARYLSEPILAFGPDLVVVHPWQASETTELLRSRGVPVLVLPSARSYDDVRALIAALAGLVGAEAVGGAWIERLDARVEELRESAARRAGLRLLVYSNTGTGGWSPGANTTSDTMIRLAGMHNAAAEDGIEGHVRIDFERFLRIDPDVIVVNELAAGRGGSATRTILTSTSALSDLSAVRHERIVVLPADLMSADSPRIVAAAERLAREVEALDLDALRGAER